ncbi:hypothetical protein GHT07_04965 [Caenimonas koreensis DSM 17982]|uniref:Uncharacterized protein n=1 Tax=Caenimonas koreensis DSM 17982 TaxID=1121255 RepID=A0A844B5L9_9BURK|nr:hypothetical protein [Caenimonas koreensis]MRD46616.1 hypothetical protein [Caenimonas koreensis DSM 17982]
MTTSPSVRAFLRPSKDRPVLDATASTAEVLADVAMSGDLIASIPVVGTAIKALRARDSFRDALFAAKLIAFIQALEEVPLHQRDEMKRRFETDETAKAAGTTLLLVLERLTDLDKPALLGFLLARFAASDIDAATLRRLASAVDLAFADDLRDFLTHPLWTTHFPTQPEAEYLSRLVAAGLTQLSVGVTWESDGNIVHSPTKLGQVLHRLVCGDR